MDRPIKTSNYTNTQKSNPLDYIRKIEDMLSQLYEKFRTILFINKVRVGTQNSYAQITSDGTYSMVGSATVFEDLRFPVTAVKINASKPPAWLTVLSSDVLAFGDEGVVTNEEGVTFIAQIPHSYKEGSNVYPHIHWMGSDTSTGNILWEFSQSWANMGTEFPTPTVSSHLVSNSNKTYHHTMSTMGVITGTGKTISSCLLCGIRRKSSIAADTYTADAYLIEADIHYEMDTLGSAEESTK